jgi:hypothetical protein
VLGIAIALTAVVAAVAGWPGVTRVGAAAAGAGALIAVASVHFGETILLRRHVGAASSGTLASSAGTGGTVLHHRLNGLLSSWFTPGYHPNDLARLALLVSLAGVTGAAVLARRRRRPDLVAFLLGVAVVAAGASLVVDKPEPISGLMIVFPAGWFALLAARRVDFPSTSSRLLGLTVALFSLGVLATQHANGGGIEWGGRYFAIALPLAAPMVATIIANRSREIGRGRILVAPLAAMSVVFALLAWIALDHGHVVNRRAITTLATEAKMAGGSPTPVIVTPVQFAPQIDWPHYFDYRWLVPQPGAIGDDTGRLTSSGVDAFVLLTSDPIHDVAAASAFGSVQSVHVPEFRVLAPADAGPVTMAVMRAHTPS